MSLEINSIATGKVTGIKDFGAFVALPDGRSGLIHISEVAQGYIDNIREHLTEGQEVRVKVLSIDDAGRINLTMKDVPELEPQPAAFETKLKDFMESAEVIAEIIESPRHDRRKKGKERDLDDYDDYEDYD